MSLPWWSSTIVVPLPSHHRLFTHHCHNLLRHPHLRSRTLRVSSFNSTAPTAILLDEIVQLYHNKVLVAAGVSAAIGQLAKPFASVILYGKEFDFRTAFGAGGFPSTHSSAVVAAATILGIERGVADSMFGLTVVYASLVMYDAQGVRREVGNHSKAVNQLLRTKSQVNSSVSFKGEDRRIDSQSKKGVSPLGRDRESGVPLLSEEPINIIAADMEEGSRTETSSWKPLKESIGHTEVEVVAGALLGFTVSLITNTLM